jgi:hypothetical protein
MRPPTTLLVIPVIALTSGAAVGDAMSAGMARTERATRSTQKIAAKRKALAEAEAGSLLATIALPAGASRSAGEPAGAGGQLASGAVRRDLGDLVDRPAWWVVPGAPSTVMSYIQSHEPNVRPFSSRFPVTLESGALYDRLQLTEGVGAIGERWLILAAVALPGGATAMRADAQVLWLRPRDAIPPGIRLIRISASIRRGTHPTAKSLTVRTPRRVSAVLALVNSLDPVRPTLLVHSCPAPFGSVRIAFYVRGPRPRARLAASIGGCGGVQLAIEGKPAQPALREPGSGLLAALDRALGDGHLLVGVQAGAVQQTHASP